MSECDPDNIWEWMVHHDPEFGAFMHMKDIFEAQEISWVHRLSKDEKITAARQYKFHSAVWSKR